MDGALVPLKSVSVAAGDDKLVQMSFADQSRLNFRRFLSWENRDGVLDFCLPQNSD